jgi:hypothetical protein
MIDKPWVEELKLKQYIIQNRSYYLDEYDDNTVELRFSPEMPEAQAHMPNGQPVEHIMKGIKEDGKIFFLSFKTVSSFGETETQLEGEDDPIMLWLQFI